MSTLDSYQPVRGQPSDEHATQWSDFRQWDDIFHFTLDVCASPRNRKCRRYWTKKDNAIAQNWLGQVCWCNPPYSHLGAWVQKIVMEAAQGVLIVALLPCLISRRWLRVIQRDACVMTLPRRLKFITADGDETTSKWDSFVAIWNATPLELAQLHATPLDVRLLTI